MPIDPNIPLSVRVPPSENPIDTMGKLYGLRHAQQTSDALDLENRERRIKLQESTDTAADEAAINAELKNVDPNDPHGMDAVGQRLAMGGHGRAALKYNAGLLKARRDEVSAQKDQLDVYTKADELQGRILGGMKDQKSYTIGRNILRAAVEKKGDPQALAAFDAALPEQYDQATVESLRTMMSSQSEQLAAHQESVREQEWGYEHGQPDKNGNIDPKAIDVAASSLGRVLAHTANDQEYQAAMKGWMAHNHPAITSSVLPRFASTWSPAAIKAAGDATMSEKDLRELGIQTEREKDEKTRLDLEGQRVKIERGRADEADQTRKDALEERKRASAYNSGRVEHDKKFDADYKLYQTQVNDVNRDPKQPAPQPPVFAPFMSREDFDAQQAGPGAPLPATPPPAVPPGQGPIAPAASQGRAAPVGPPPVAAGSPAAPQIPAPAAPARPVAPAQPAAPVAPPAGTGGPTAPTSAAAPPAKPAAPGATAVPPKGHIRIARVAPNDIRVQTDDGKWTKFTSQADLDKALKKGGYNATQ